MGKFPEACFRRQAAYIRDFTSHESVQKRFQTSSGPGPSSRLQGSSSGVSKKASRAPFWVPTIWQTLLPGFFRKYKNPSSENIRTLYYVVSLWNTIIIIRKNENPGLTEKSRFWWEISGQINFSTENLISSYGHDEHFGRAVCPKPILKVWFWMKTFLMSM